MQGILVAFSPVAAMVLIVGLCHHSRAEEPLLKFVSVPDFLNMDVQHDDPRLFDLTAARRSQLVEEINSGGPQSTINPYVGNFIGTVENGYRGASQVLLEALAAENPDFFTVSGDLLYTRWPKGSQLTQPWAHDHIRQQADIYYDAWIDNAQTYAGFDLSEIYTIVGDHEIGDNDWGANKRPLIPTYREVYVNKVGNESTVAGGAYVQSPAGFEGRTYAVQRDNLLLVGVDQFETFTSSGNYTNVGSQMASVKTDVTGAQFQWLNSTLTQANNDPTLDHIIVMGHVPIAGRDFVKIQETSSGLMNNTGEDGALWQLFVDQGVDLFMPGEVHAVSMQMAENVLQVVTGTNVFQPTNGDGIGSIPFNLNTPVTSEQNYMVVDVYEDRIDLTIKQIETKIWGFSGNGNDPLNDEPYKNREARVAAATAQAGFQVTGTLTIDKSGGTPVYTNRSGLFISEWTFGAPVNIDLNGDNQIDAADAHQFLMYIHTDLSGLPAAEAYARGDLNGDFRSNHADFRLFKDAYDVQAGAGAFDALLLQVPEPSTAATAILVAALYASTFRRRNKNSSAFIPSPLWGGLGRGLPLVNSIDLHKLRLGGLQCHA